MEALTPAERRAVVMVLLLLVLGCGWDLWRATRPLPVVRVPAGAAVEPPGSRESGAVGSMEVASRSDSTGAARLDLNRATLAELDRLPGIGPVLAGRIVEHRRRFGPFTRLEDLMAVRGIGPRLYARLAPRLSVAPGPPYKEEPSRSSGPAVRGGRSARGVQSAAGAGGVRADSTSVPPGASR